MAESLADVLARVRGALLDDEVLLRALASGRRKGAQPPWRRLELRYVDLRAGRHLQLTAYDDTMAHTTNYAIGDEAADAVDGLLAEPFGNWHVETASETLQVRVTKKGDAMVHESGPSSAVPSRSHDRTKERLLQPDDPVLVALGISDAGGRVKPSRQAKYRQVEEFLRALAAALGEVRLPTSRPARIADLGCGNAYLTFAAHRYLAGVRGLAVELIGVDVKAQSYVRNTELAKSLGVADTMRFVQAPISSSALDTAPDVVLALHACDTATDDALAAAVEWRAPLVLAAPCCHHDVAAQLRGTPSPSPYSLLTRHGILRERFADTLTDALRAAVLRERGYRVDVMEFVESQHTPRNTLLRAVRTESTPEARAHAELDELMAAWQVRPRLAELLGLLDA